MRICVILCVYLFGCPLLPAQPEVRVDVGRSIIGEQFPGEAVYDVWLISAGYAWRYTKTEKPVRLNGTIELHYADASTVSHGKNDFELISNLGIELLLRSQRAIDFRIALGTGPGYQSSDSGHQARGFIYSNNLSAGVRIRLGETHPVYIIPQVRFRHLSNARFTAPNTGIDNFLALISIGIPL